MGFTEVAVEDSVNLTLSFRICSSCCRNAVECRHDFRWVAPFPCVLWHSAESHRGVDWSESAYRNIAVCVRRRLKRGRVKLRQFPNGERLWLVAVDRARVSRSGVLRSASGVVVVLVGTSTRMRALSCCRIAVLGLSPRTYVAPN